MLNTVTQQVAVGQAGQAVVVGLLFQRMLVAHALADVVDDADKVGGRAIGQVLHRCNVQFVPKQRSILAVVAQGGRSLAIFTQR